MGGDGQALGNKRKLLDKQSSYLTRTSEDAGEKEGNDKEEVAARWSTCAISLEPLEPPVCFDIGGHLFSKQSVIGYLLELKKSASQNGDETDRDSNAPFPIRRLSDVCEVANADDTGNIRCPITGFLASSGQHAFVGLWNCGHTIAASALVLPKDHDEHRPFVGKCPVCETEGFTVRLILSQAESKVQVESLRDLLRKTRKRQRRDA